MGFHRIGSTFTFSENVRGLRATRSNQNHPTEPQDPATAEWSAGSHGHASTVTIVGPEVSSAGLGVNPEVHPRTMGAQSVQRLMWETAALLNVCLVNGHSRRAIPLPQGVARCWKTQHKPQEGAMTLLAEPDSPALSQTTAARAQHASKTYGRGETEVRALDDVSISFETGRLTAIMGPSGSGKSTLMHCVAGLDQLSAGQVFIGETELGRLSERQLTLLRRGRIGFIFQAFNLIPTLSASENITLPMDLAGETIDQAWMEDVVRAVGLADRLSHRPDELSGGQQQRVAVARALASRPEIIFADEPTGNLDSRAGAEILDFMAAAVRDLAQTIVMVTHDPVAAGYADRVVFLADGRVIDEMAQPTPDSVLDRMRSLER